MVLYEIFVVLWCVYFIPGYRADENSYGYQELTPEELKRLNEWNEDSEQNIWELSGQFEGDIVLQGQKNGQINKKFYWPKNTVVLAFEKDVAPKQQAVVINSLKEISQKTCIKFRNATSQDKNYVLVSTKKPGCFSNVGRTGGRQILNLQNPDCFKHEIIVHEFTHAIGFWHMQSDSQRDEYVTIMLENVQKGMEYNFEKISSSEASSFGESYDYGSLMHYGPYAFSKNKKKTIVTKDPNAVIGEAKGLSKIDVNKINKMYKCK